jgi:hypothetical protein
MAASLPAAAVHWRSGKDPATLGFFFRTMKHTSCGPVHPDFFLS